MEINRREFLVLGVSFLAGCAGTGRGGTLSAAAREKTIDAGPAEAFGEDGLYDRFRNQGFFLIRREGQLLALSSSCTHRNCILNVASDRTFICPCHGSTFDAHGAVTKGPAQLNIPRFPLRVDDRGRVLVQVPDA